VCEAVLDRRLDRSRVTNIGGKTGRAANRNAAAAISKRLAVATTSRGNADKYIVKPLLKALRVLHYIGRSAEPVRLKDIVIGVKLHKTTVLRYLRTFEAAGVVVRDVSGEFYWIDVRLAGSLNTNLVVERLRLACRPYLEKL
jgi:hypothetical protein